MFYLLSRDGILLTAVKKYKGLNSTQVKALEQASENPLLFITQDLKVKPWNNRATFAEYYFYFLRQTYWYEDVQTVF